MSTAYGNFRGYSHRAAERILLLSHQPGSMDRLFKPAQAAGKPGLRHSTASQHAAISLWHTPLNAWAAGWQRYPKPGAFKHLL